MSINFAALIGLLLYCTVPCQLFILSPSSLKEGFTPIPVTDPIVKQDIDFAVSEINRLSSSKYLVKAIQTWEAYILLNEYVRLTFDLGTTICPKDSTESLDSCSIDLSKPITTCDELIVDNTPWREVAMKVTQFGNCLP